MENTTLIIDGRLIEEGDILAVNFGSKEKEDWRAFEFRYFLPNGYYCEAWQEHVEGQHIWAYPVDGSSGGYGMNIFIGNGCRLQRKKIVRQTLPYGW